MTTRPKFPIRPLTAALLVLTFLARPGAVWPAHAGEPQVANDPAGGPGDNENKSAIGRAAGEFIEDTARIWSAPFRIKDRDVAPLIVISAATAFLIAADEDIRNGAKDYSDTHGWVHDFGSAMTRMGGWGALATAGAFFGIGLVFKEERARDTGILAMNAMAQSFLVTNILKGFSGRQRPYYGDGSDRWAGPVGFFKRYEKANEGLYSSFPSGHAATAFSLATVVALQYRHRAWVQVLAYTVAAAVSLSRVTEDRHWMSDVVVGSVLGHFIARLVVHNHNKRLRLMPVLGCAGRSITFGFHYAPGPAY